MSHTDGAQTLLSDIRAEWDKGDPWGSAMRALFSVADALYWLDPNAVPTAWQYRPGGNGSIDLDCEDYWQARDYLATLGVPTEIELWGDTEEEAVTALAQVGRVLDRLCDMYRADGIDY